jgi:hypothetical protein
VSFSLRRVCAGVCMNEKQLAARCLVSLPCRARSCEREREGEIIGENLRDGATPVIIYNIGPCLLSRCCYRPFIKNAVAARFVQLNSLRRFPPYYNMLFLNNLLYFMSHAALKNNQECASSLTCCGQCKYLCTEQNELSLRLWCERLR